MPSISFYFLYSSENCKGHFIIKLWFSFYAPHSNLFLFCRFDGDCILLAQCTKSASLFKCKCLRFTIFRRKGTGKVEMENFRIQTILISQPLRAQVRLTRLQLVALFSRVSQSNLKLEKIYKTTPLNTTSNRYNIYLLFFVNNLKM